MACVMRSTYLSFCPTVFSSPVEKERAQVFFFGGGGGLVGCFCVLCFVSPPFLFFFFRCVFDNIPLCLAFPL